MAELFLQIMLHVSCVGVTLCFFALGAVTRYIPIKMLLFPAGFGSSLVWFVVAIEGLQNVTLWDVVNILMAGLFGAFFFGFPYAIAVLIVVLRIEALHARSLKFMAEVNHKRAWSAFYQANRTLRHTHLYNSNYWYSKDWSHLDYEHEPYGLPDWRIST